MTEFILVSVHREHHQDETVMALLKNANHSRLACQDQFLFMTPVNYCSNTIDVCFAKQS